MKKIIVLAILLGGVVFLFSACSSLTVNPRRMACYEACAQAREKCYADAKGNAIQRAACDVTHDQCREKCNREFP